MISFGPIPSRRLGKSLGINNIPSQKTCSYSCIYCQVGITKKYCTVRENFYEPEIIYQEIKKHLQKLKATDMPDYLTFVANGEPTLDINLGKSVKKLKEFNIPIAVITNATLLNLQQVKDDLKLADWVSIKVDTNIKDTWNEINKPSPLLNFEKHIEGMLQFTLEDKGKLVTETMLVEGVNDNYESLQATAKLIKQLNPVVAYISVPTRPPAVSTVKAPGEISINNAFQIFSENGLNAELILGFEGTDAGYTGNAIEDIINICTVHPIRKDTMLELLKNNKVSEDLLTSLIRSKLIKQVDYKHHSFYIRQFLV